MCAAAALALVWVVPSGAPREGGELVELWLPSGDHLVAPGDARFEVESVAPDHRLVRGAMLFDVAPSAGGGFEVRTPEEIERVRGTVFAVEVSDRGISVRVFEGSEASSAAVSGPPAGSSPRPRRRTCSPRRSSAPATACGWRRR